MLFVAIALTGCESWHNAVNSIAEAGDRKADGSYKSSGYYSSSTAYGNPNVEIYNLNRTQEQETQLQPVQSAPQDFSQPIGRPADGSPGVTVFSVDDEWNTQPAAPVRPTLAPPSQYREDIPSPFNEGSLRSKSPSNLKTVYFSHGSSHVNAQGQKVVRAVADLHKDGRYGSLSVVGHSSKRAETTDPVQRSIVNMKMSMKRAMRVSEGLIRQGVPAESIKTSALGDSRAAMNLNGMSQEAANRRVEISTAQPYKQEYKSVQLEPSTYMTREFPAGGPVTLLPLN